MPRPIEIRNRKTLLNSQKQQYTQRIKSLLNFAEYKQTLFSISNEEGNFLIPASKIRSVVQKAQGSIIHCQNNLSINSSHSMEYWQNTLNKFDWFITTKESSSVRVIKLSTVDIGS